MRREGASLGRPLDDFMCHSGVYKSERARLGLIYLTFFSSFSESTLPLPIPQAPSQLALSAFTVRARRSRPLIGSSRPSSSSFSAIACASSLVPSLQSFPLPSGRLKDILCAVDLVPTPARFQFSRNSQKKQVPHNPLAKGRHDLTETPNSRQSANPCLCSDQS